MGSDVGLVILLDEKFAEISSRNKGISLAAWECPPQFLRHQLLTPTVENLRDCAVCVHPVHPGPISLSIGAHS